MFADQQDLEQFGYRQQLERSLGGFSVFAAGFSYISILTGLFQTFYLGFGAADPAFIWTWPVVLGGQLLVALCFAELAAHYPLSGGVYQWSKRLGGVGFGCLTGGIYVACLVVTLAAVALALQNTLPLITTKFQLIGSASNKADSGANAVLLGSLLILVSTLISSYGIRLVSRINDLGVIAEIVGILLLILLLGEKAVRGPHQFLWKPPATGIHSYGPFSAFLAAMGLTASYVLYGYDTAGSLAEETHDPRRNAPKAILRALLAAGLAGLLVILVALMAAPDLQAASLGAQGGGLPLLVREVLGEHLGRLFLCDVAFAIGVCTLAVQAGTARLVFAMARDGHLPFSSALGRISSRFHTPILATLLTGGGAALVLVINLGFPHLFELITSVAILWANLSYLLVVTSLLVKRIRGWPEGESPGIAQLFGLGRWGIGLNTCAIVWCLFTVVNVGWPRPEVYGSDRLHQYAPIWMTAALILLGIWWQAQTARRLTAVPACNSPQA